MSQKMVSDPLYVKFPFVKIYLLLRISGHVQNTLLPLQIYENLLLK